jgi:hypothetical protein
MPEPLQPDPDRTVVSEQDLDEMLARARCSQSPEDASALPSTALHGQYFGHYVNDVPLLIAEIRRLRRLLRERSGE